MREPPHYFSPDMFKIYKNFYQLESWHIMKHTLHLNIHGGYNDLLVPIESISMP